MILNHTKDKVLLVKNKNGTWSFPGGRREIGETLQQTAKREAFEEVGLDINPHDICAISEVIGSDIHDLFVVFRFYLAYEFEPSLVRDVSIESIEWVYFDEASKRLPWYPQGIKGLIENHVTY